MNQQKLKMLRLMKTFIQVCIACAAQVSFLYFISISGRHFERFWKYFLIQDTEFFEIHFIVQ